MLNWCFPPKSPRLAVLPPSLARKFSHSDNKAVGNILIFFQFRIIKFSVKMQSVELTLKVCPDKAGRKRVRQEFRACWECGKCGPSLKSCARCMTATYCGSVCQRAGWDAGHKRECKCIIPLKKNTPPTRSAGLWLSQALATEDWSKYAPTVWMIMYKPRGPNGRDITALCLAPPGYREILRAHKAYLPRDRHVFKLAGDCEGNFMFFEIFPGKFPQRVGVKVIKAPADYVIH